ncbi:MAG TPA: hypothetical protein VKU02_18930, partial [Gemmataceae bacterium]|nr:hypothetical protein [Gemmataceae bacterium]
MRRVWMRRALLGMFFAFAALTVSCGERGERLPETGASLEGTITYGGVRVPFATVTVMGTNWMATGKVQGDGRYRVANAPLGEVTVGVNTTAAKGDFVSKVMAESKGKGRSPAKFVDVP